MKKQFNLLKTTIFLLIALLIYDYSFAKIIRDDQGDPIPWNKTPEAYRPAPILFSHGFASGDPTETWIGRNGQKENQRPEIDTKLWDKFSNYYYDYKIEGSSRSPLKALDTTRKPYLEIVSYIDTSKDERSQLIDRNSSVDTYQKGDYYVSTKERKIGDSGWADKLNEAVKKMRDIYKDKNGYPLKINIICHSMGGLAAREYLTNSKYGSSASNVNDLVLIGVPNLGSPLATFATGLAASQRIAWAVNPTPYVVLGFETAKELEKDILVFGKIDAKGDAERDMDIGLLGSGFIHQLNNRAQPQNVDYYAVCGLSMTLWEYLSALLINSESGDTVVPVSSQLGAGVLKLKDYKIIKNASHGSEILAVSKNDGDILLKFLDSEKPIVEITDPDPQSMEETYESSIKIKGKVSREYLPADSLLQIEAVNQDTGERAFELNDRGLYPSDLWVPSDPDSVVAEFEQEIPLTAPGKYKITCKIENPAKVTSEVKEVWVKKLKIEGSNIIVHCHNPEGKEIGSITANKDTVIGNAVGIYDGDNRIGNGAKNAASHGSPISLETGSHTIKVKFNGMEQVKNVTLAQKETKSLIFEFKRDEFDIAGYINSNSINKTLSTSHPTAEFNAINELYIDKTTGSRIWHNMYCNIWNPGGSVSSNHNSSIQFSATNYELHLFVSVDWNLEASSDPYYDRWDIEIASAIYCYSGFLKRCPLPAIPANGLFNEWYVQKKLNGYTGGFIFGFDSSPWQCTVIPEGNWNNEYIASTLPRQANIINSYFTTTSKEAGLGSSNDRGDGSHTGSATKSIDLSGTISNFKMSSVPYDLDGKAI